MHKVVRSRALLLWLSFASVLVAFGLTIVIKRASRPFAVNEPDDDV